MNRSYIFFFFISLTWACNNSSSDYYQKGDTLYHLGRYEEANIAFEGAIELAPSDLYKYDSYFYLAHTKLYLGDSLAALDIFTQMLSLFPDSGNIYMNRAFLYFHLDELDKAQIDLEKITHFPSNNMEAILLKAKIHIFLGEYQYALDDLDYLIVEIDPQKIEAYEWRSILKHKMGNERGAHEDFITAEELGSELTKNYINTDVLVYGYIRDEANTLLLDDVKVEIFIYKQNDWIEINTSWNDDEGVYHTKLDMDYLYKIKFSKTDYVSKFITIDLRRVPIEDQLYGYKMQTDMNLFLFTQGFDLGIMNDPIGKAKYDPISASIEWDKDYTYEMKEKISIEKNEVK